MRTVRPAVLAASAFLAVPALASHYEATSVTTVTGPVTNQSHLVSTGLNISTNTALSSGDNHGDATANCGLKYISCACHASAFHGGGISYNSAYATTTDRVQLLSRQLQPGEVATVFFGVSFTGGLSGGSSSSGDNSWFQADVVGGISLGDVNDGVYGNIDSFPDTDDPQPRRAPSPTPRPSPTATSPTFPCPSPRTLTATLIRTSRATLRLRCPTTSTPSSGWGSPAF